MDALEDAVRAEAELVLVPVSSCMSLLVADGSRDEARATDSDMANCNSRWSSSSSSSALSSIVDAAGSTAVDSDGGAAIGGVVSSDEDKAETFSIEGTSVVLVGCGGAACSSCSVCCSVFSSISFSSFLLALSASFFPLSPLLFFLTLM